MGLSPMKPIKWTLIALLAMGSADATRAWDRTGHQVVARIAWEEMQPESRTRAIELLAAAPPDASLAQLLPQTSRPLAVRQAEHFQLAAYWSDIVRDGAFPERRQKYHRGNWHYINWFFEQVGPENAPRERTDLKAQPTNVVERLGALSVAVADETLPASERAIHLAWILHLTGDVHQPLHATARVTELEPQGDRGGNLVSLGKSRNLHSFWDGILRSSNFHWWFQREDSYIQKIAKSIATEHPRSGFGASAASLDVEAWGRESFEIARDELYPADLVRDAKPSRAYFDRAVRIGRRQVALAGYRLAVLLDASLR